MLGIVFPLVIEHSLLEFLGVDEVCRARIVSPLWNATVRHLQKVRKWNLVHDEDINVVQWLQSVLKSGVTVGNIMMADEEVCAAIVEICMSGHAPVLRFLRTSLPSKQYRDFVVNSVIHGFVDPRGMTVLHYTAQYKHLDVARLLLEVENIDVNCQDNKGLAPLHWAARVGCHDVVEALVAAPSLNVNARDAVGRTALHCAADEGHVEVVSVLLPLEGITSNIAADNGKTPLMCAIEYRNTGVVTLLLTALDVFTNINVDDNNGHTSLHFAAWLGNTDVGKLLLNVPGIDVNAQLDWTPLHFAASNGHTEFVKLLLECDVPPLVDTALVANDGRTAIDVARENGHDDVVEVLSPEVEDDDGDDDDVTSPLNDEDDGGLASLVSREDDDDLSVQSRG